jgi:uncharacterized protein
MKKTFPLVFATLAVLGAGCSSTPPPRFHSLVSHQASTEKSTPGPALLIDLNPVSVPSSVDQPQWLVRTADNTFRLLEQERWVAPLRDEIRASLMAELTRRWNAVNLRTTNVAAPNTGWRLSVSVVRCDMALDAQCTATTCQTTLEATWVATPLKPDPIPKTLACTHTLHEPADATLLSLAQAQRRALAKLVDHIGAQLQAQQAGKASACSDHATAEGGLPRSKQPP